MRNRYRQRRAGTGKRGQMSDSPSELPSAWLGLVFGLISLFGISGLIYVASRSAIREAESRERARRLAEMVIEQVVATARERQMLFDSGSQRGVDGDTQ